jgi:hypothetical protein
MSSQLKIDWCNHAAAKYAVEHWHYSECMPAGKMVKVGAWENGKFIGCVLFSQGANNHLGTPYGLKMTECCELTRIALTNHATPVTRIVSITLKFLKLHCPGLRLIVSYADPEQGHHGGIYQGGGWLYTGTSQAQREVIVNGKVMHKRSANAKYGTIIGLEKSKILFKHKYLMPLDSAMKNQIEPLRKPYPKRAVSIVSNVPAIHAGEGGLEPTTALH